uniref:Epidermal growth factor receptor pathway substrate 15 like 1 n=1 Tax=Amphiprion ocellaris TaxID=80972 RepID=A0AAQ5YX23_AMPOC
SYGLSPLVPARTPETPGNMAALMTLSQLSNGSPAYENHYRQLDPGNTGKISAGDAAQFLKKSGLSDSTLGKIWDLADSERKGYLDKRGFFIALRLVASAQGGNDISLNNLNQNLAAPKFKDTNSPLLSASMTTLDSQWAIRHDEKGKFEGIFESLSPVNGLLSGDKVRPVLVNSKLPLDVLGRIWDLSDVDKDGHLDKEEFTVPVVNWVVPVADRERYDDIFKKTDTDGDGLVTGSEVIEIFMQSTLSQTMLAQIWGLADTKQVGKLTREQFSLAMYLIQQKVAKGIDPPSTLTPEMIPPSERTDGTSSTGSAELTGIKELDDLSQEIAQLQREKFILDQEIREKEEAIRQQNSDVQDMQNDLDRESSSLQDLESQKQDAQERLEEMDQQRSKLEGMLNDVKQKCQEETQMISSLQSQIRSQETDLRSQEDELSRTKADLSRLQEEEAQLEQSLLSGRVQLDSIIKSLKTTQEEISQARSKLSLIQDSQKEMTKTIEEYNSALSDISGGNFSNLPDLSGGFAEKENGGFRSADDSFKLKIAMFNNNSSTKETPADPFQTEDPFKSDLFNGLYTFCIFLTPHVSTTKDPFGGDHFKESDPFKGTSSEDFFKRTDKSDLFGSADPFGRKPTPPVKVVWFFFLFLSFSVGEQKSDNPVLPSKKNVPNRPAPPYGNPIFYTVFVFLCFGSESQQLEWAKQESEREEQERLKRLRLQEQQDLELAIALSKADMSDA